MQLEVFLLVFVVIFIAELPDKSLFASLILGSRFNGWYVWLGTASAFLVHVCIAVTAGKLLTFLPHRLLEAVIALLFLAGATLLFFGKHGIEEEPSVSSKVSLIHVHSFWKVFSTSFGVVFLGEWGDVTQIATANYAARYHDPWAVGLGALLALWVVAGLAVTLGAKAIKLVPAKTLQRTSGTILLLFAILSIISAIR
jgi:Ca2+/H+ antiporter, TMEM165/GDT1 family